MIQSITQNKICRVCKIEKPIDEFYEHNGRHENKCKVCKRAKKKQYTAHDKRYSPNYGENLVIEKLKSMGIYAAPGKSSEWKHIDVVVWGCVKIEVKMANAKPNGSYQFSFASQSVRGLKSDLIVLIPLNEQGGTFHIFYPDHPAFFRTDNNIEFARSATGRKNAVHFNPDRSCVKSTFGETLSPEVMAEHQNLWGLIEECRLKVVNRLISETSMKKAIAGQILLI